MNVTLKQFGDAATITTFETDLMPKVGEYISYTDENGNIVNAEIFRIKYVLSISPFSHLTRIGAEMVVKPVAPPNAPVV